MLESFNIQYIILRFANLLIIFIFYLSINKNLSHFFILCGKKKIQFYAFIEDFVDKDIVTPQSQIDWR